MGKCRVNTQNLEQQQLSLSLPSAVAVQITSRDCVTSDGKLDSMVEVRRKDGKAFRQGDREEVEQFVVSKVGAFGSFLQGVFENWHLSHNKIKFSGSWFDGMEQGALIVLKAGNICDIWTKKPVKPETRQSQRRIAQAILSRCQRGREALKSHSKSADRFGAEIVQLWARLLSEVDRIRGQKIARSTRKGGKAKGEAYAKQKIDWQAKAEIIWSMRPNLSKRSVARNIANTSNRDEASTETIRKAIKRPRKIGAK